MGIKKKNAFLVAALSTSMMSGMLFTGYGDSLLRAITNDNAEDNDSSKSPVEENKINEVPENVMKNATLKVLAENNSGSDFSVQPNNSVFDVNSVGVSTTFSDLLVKNEKIMKQKAAAEKIAEVNYNKATARLNIATNAYNEAVSEQAKAEAEYNAMKEKYPNVDADLIKDREALANAESALNDAKKNLSNAEAAYNNAVSALNTQNALYDKAVSDKNIAANNVTAAESRVNAAESAVSKAQAEFDAVSVDSEAYNTVLNKVNEAQAELNAAQSALDSANSVLATKQNALNEANASLDNVKATIADYSSRKDVLNKELAKAQSNYDTLSEAFSNKMEEKGTSEAELKEAQESLTATEDALNRANTKVSTAQVEFNKASSLVDTEQAKYNKAKADAESAKKIATENLASAGLAFFDSTVHEGWSVMDWVELGKLDVGNTFVPTGALLNTNGKKISMSQLVQTPEFLYVLNQMMLPENIQKSIDFIKKANELRALQKTDPNDLNQEYYGQPLPELKISHELMAFAVYSNAVNYFTMNHATISSQTGTTPVLSQVGWILGSECLAGGAEDPFTGWYDMEKELWDQGYRDIEKYNLGHYLALMDATAVVTGFSYGGIQTPGTNFIDYESAQEFGREESPDLGFNDSDGKGSQSTVSDYEAMFKAFMKDLEDKVAETTAECKRLESEPNVLVNAKTSLTLKANALASAKEAQNIANINNTVASKNVSDIQNELDTINSELSVLKSNADKAAADLQDAKDNLAELEATHKSEEATLAAAEKVVADAETEYNNALSARDNKVSERSAKQSLFDEANEDLTLIGMESHNARERLITAIAVLRKAESDLETANNTLDNMTDNANSLKNELSNAETVKNNAKTALDNMITIESSKSSDVETAKAKLEADTGEYLKAKADYEDAVEQLNKAAENKDVLTIKKNEALDAYEKAQTELEVATIRYESSKLAVSASN